MLSVENFAYRYKRDVPSFDNFLVGESNSEAFNLVKDIAENPFTEKCSPLFIQGKAGCGKTHLLKALYIKLMDLKDYKVLHISCEMIAAHLLSFIRKGGTDILCKRFLGVDVLLIDDCEYASLSEYLQIEMSKLIKSMAENNKQVVLAVSGEEEKLPVLKESLNFEYKEVSILEPDYEFRKTYLNDLLKRNNMKLTRGITKYILKRCKNNFSLMKCAVNKIRLMELVSKKPVTLKKVKSWI